MEPTGIEPDLLLAKQAGESNAPTEIGLDRGLAGGSIRLG